MMSEMRGGMGVGVGVDPSKLHLKKELTQIRKAARVLRDPGTTCSWRSSPVASSSARARSTAVLSAEQDPSSRTPISNHYYHHYTNRNRKASRDGNDEDGGRQQLEPSSVVQVNGGSNQSSEQHHLSTKSQKGRKEKKVFLYNWRVSQQKSESDPNASFSTIEQLPPRGNAAAAAAASRNDDDDESLSDARNGGNGEDSKSDTNYYLADRYMYASFVSKKPPTPIRRTPPVKKRPNRKNSTYKSAAVLKHQMERQLSSVDHSDDTEEYLHSEDLNLKRVYPATSPLLSRLKSSKFLRGSRKEDNSSYYTYSTPALSTSSFRVKNLSAIGSWDATTASFNDDEDEEEGDDQLGFPGRQGCGIPCYWSRRTTPKRGRMCGSCYSPSFSDTLRRKGSSILRGRKSVYRHRRLRGLSVGSYKKRLICSGDGGGGSSAGTDDELSTNIGELDMEALSRLDGRRWSTSCRSQEGLELVVLNGEREEDSTPENSNNFSQKYRPMFFEDVVGQNVVVQSLMNAILRGRIAPIYLFQGPRGTGKTSTARIFAAALSCLATQENKPCGVCRECADFISGKSRDLTEIDGSNKEGIDGVRQLLKNLQAPSSSSTFTRNKVYIIDECHLLPSKLWVAFLKFLEKPLPDVVFIFVTTDLDNVPRTVLSRCQKYLFNKIKDRDIVNRLRKISADEDIAVELDALELIAVNVEGSLRDAETMLDQLSLLGKRITTSLVNELVGVISDEKLLELLELAMSSDTAKTVKRARELMDSGVDPMVLMSQLATLIMDIIAGTYQVVESRDGDSIFDGRSLTDAELGRLKHALKLLSEAEKQLRVSSERSTWFTATLLQLGSVHSPDPTQSGSSRRQSSKTTEDGPSSFRDAFFLKDRHDANYGPQSSTPLYLPKGNNQKSTSAEDSLSLKDGVGFNTKRHTHLSADALSISRGAILVANTIPGHMDSHMLDNIWMHCIGRCHSKTLRQLLHTYGKLVSISEVEGITLAYIAFGNREIKTRAERFLSSITNSFEIVLSRNIEVRIILLSNDGISPNSAEPIVLPNSSVQKQMETAEMTRREIKAFSSNGIDDYSDRDSLEEPLKVLRGSLNDSDCKLARTVQSSAGSPILLSARTSAAKGKKSGNSAQRIESIIHEQRLETAWLQTADKGTPGSVARLKPERNQVLPQDGLYQHNQMQSVNPVSLTHQHWEDELTNEINYLKVSEGKDLQKEPNGKRIDHYPTSPSLLHDSSLVGQFSKESIGYESGSGAGGCSGLLCWNSKNRKRGKTKQGIPVRSEKSRRFLWFGECAKSRRTENRLRL